MTRTAERLVSDSSGDFDNVLDQMRDTTWGVMWRQDSFVAATFERFSAQPYLFPDQQAGDDIAAYHEEHVHPEQAAPRPRDAGVIEQHRHHGKGPDAVEGREPQQPAGLSTVPEPSRSSCRRGIREERCRAGRRRSGHVTPAGRRGDVGRKVGRSGRTR